MKRAWGSAYNPSSMDILVMFFGSICVENPTLNYNSGFYTYQYVLCKSLYEFLVELMKHGFLVVTRMRKKIIEKVLISGALTTHSFLF